MRVLRAVGAGSRAGGRGLLRALRAAGLGAKHAVRRLVDPGARGRVLRHWSFLGAVWITAVAMFFIAFGVAGLTYDDIDLGVAPVIGAIAGLPILFLVIDRPAVGWAISVSGAFVLAVALPLKDADPWSWGVPHGLVMLTLLFAVCVRERLGPALGAWFITAWLFAWGTAPDLRSGWVVGVSAVAVFGLLAGRLARAQRSLARQEQLTAEEQSRRLVLEERARIARDLHDIVAHHMSLVAVQAETAPYRLPGLPDDARAELDSISASARSALAETRVLLGVLRQHDQPAEHAPQPGLQLLDELVDGARRAGVPIEASVQGDVAGLRPGASLAAYRVLQEALANAARHAPGAAVRLDVSREPDTLTLAVLNDAVMNDAGHPGPVADTVGHGITGMRERVSAEGGTLRIGPTETGGFAVRATLPLAAR